MAFMFASLSVFAQGAIPYPETTYVYLEDEQTGDKCQVIGTFHFGTYRYFYEVRQLTWEEYPVIHDGGKKRFPHLMLMYVMLSKLFVLHYEDDRLPLNTENWITVDVSRDGDYGAGDGSRTRILKVANLSAYHRRPLRLGLYHISHEEASRIRVGGDEHR